MYALYGEMWSGMLSPRTGLGLEAKNWSWPRCQWPRPQPRDTAASASCCLASWSRLLQCMYFVLCRNCYCKVSTVIMKTKDGNVVNEARSGQGREKKLGNRVQLYRCYHLALTVSSVIKLRIYIVNPLWPRPRSRILLASLTSLFITLLNMDQC